MLSDNWAGAVPPSTGAGVGSPTVVATRRYPSYSDIAYCPINVPGHAT